MFQTNVVKTFKTHILFSITIFRKSWRLWDNLEKKMYRRTGHRWQYGALALHAG